MEILKLIGIAIVESRAKSELDGIKEICFNRMGIYREMGDTEDEMVVFDVLKAREQEILTRRAERIERIDKLLSRKRL